MEEIRARYEREKEYHNMAFAEDTRATADKYYSIFIVCRKYVTDFLESNSRNKKVLEYGCGEGSYAFSLSKIDAFVTAIDISDVAIENAKVIAKNEGLNDIDFKVMNAEELLFENNSFDLVCGTAILHHLDLKKSCLELVRVLNTNGKAIFMEPLGHNPIINAYRKLTPKMRTVDEHPLMMSDLKMLEKYFSTVEVKYFYLLALFAVPFRNTVIFKMFLKFLMLVDEVIFLVPFFRKYAWYTVITVQNPKKELLLVTN